MADSTGPASEQPIKKTKKDNKNKQQKKEKQGKSSVVQSASDAPAGPSAPTTSIFGGGSVDPALSSLFAASTSYAAVPLPAPSQPVPAASAQLKRKREETAPESAPSSLPASTRKPGKKERPARPSKADKDASQAASDAPLPQGSKPSPAPTQNKGKAKAAADEPESDADEQDEVENLVHESLLLNKAGANKRDRGAKKKNKWAPEDETSEDRDRRTIFVGNVDVAAAKDKSALKQFRAHLLQFAPSAQIEAVRFRSLAFAAPTAGMPVDVDTPEGEKEVARREKREKERAAKWREEHGEEPARGGRAAAANDEAAKTYLKPSEKRKVAYIKGDFHAEAPTAHAYVVMAYHPPDRSANVPPILDPFIAADQIISKGNLSLFMGHALHLDHVRPTLSAIEAAAAKEGKSTLPAKREAWTQGADVKSCLFVGNLDYASKEDDVRAFFEGLVKAERGARTLLPGEQTTAAGPTWVRAVRLIRDRETQLGKGFGYVQFVDAECVDEVLALPSDKLKFAKKHVRVESCKTLPPSLGGRVTPVAAAKKAAPGASTKPNGKPGKPARPASKPVPKPILPMVKGDPSLGAKLASLSKEERKAAKSTDEQRLARRAAKKQGAKIKQANADKGTRVKLDVRSNRKDGPGKLKAKKSRVRSAHAATKMKGKRD